MNYKESCDILEIDPGGEITLEKIKKQYRLKALLYHPDKNKSPDASENFLKVKSAYDYLLKSNDYNSESEEEDDDEETLDKSSYRWKMYSFLKSILRKESTNATFYNILQKISSVCEENALTLIDKLDKVVLIKVFGIMKTYKEAFHFTAEFIEKVEDIVKKKKENDEYIILKPSLDDLFENNLYKLSIDNKSYIVPLWHHELLYDHSGNEICVKCEPVLPNNMEIDNKNNLHVHLKYNIIDLWCKSKELISIGTKKTVELIPSDLRFSNIQTIVISEGISKINTNNVYDISNKALIYLHITMDL
jgi:hypothetical protein